MNERRRQSELFTAKHEAGRKPVPSDVPTTPQDAPKLKEIRNELQDIIKKGTDVLGHEEFTRIYSEEQKGGEIGLLQDKEVKRKKYKHSQEFQERKLNQAQEVLVVCNDFQFPDCDSEAVGAFLKFVKDNKQKITHFVINGDLADNKMQSKFAKDLDELHERTSAEIEQTDWFLASITKLLPDAKKVWVSGNHDLPRWENMLKNNDQGVKPWLKTIEEMFSLKERGWEFLEYGKGQAYKWHDRLIWHGSRSGAKSNIGKMELEDTGVSSTTGHVNRNAYWEARDALGNLRSGIAHGGFSRDNLDFVKKANSAWSLGFGVYYWHKQLGEQPYMVIVRHGSGKFIAPDGTLYSGKGFKIGDKVR